MLSTEGLTGQIILQSSPGYNQARKNYNGRFNKFPLIIVYCENTQDVINAILWVRKHRLPLRVRGGGHSYEAFSLVNGGLIIDVSPLLGFQISSDKGSVRIGAGFRLTPLYEALWNAGLVVPGGTCPTVCVSGLTLGGGYGLLSRLFGMLCDNLLEFQMITPQGQLITANESSHPDLFWACRGGGQGSFGVITSFTFRTHPIGNVSRYRMTWNFDALKTLVNFWQVWAPYADSRLTSLLALPSQNQGDLRSSGVFVGSEQELRSIVRPLQEISSPNTIEFHTSSWLETAYQFGGIPVQQELFKNSSAYVYEPLPNIALDTIISNLRSSPGPVNLVTFDAYGGAISQTPANQTAFVHRKALFSVQYQSYWTQPQDENKNIQWIEKFRSSLLPYTYGAYSNYCDLMIPDWPTAYYGANLPSLKMVKQMYDPENLFQFEQSIPL
ncbi:MAG: FAD-binding oxidoreductase [Eubacteriales bacterium]|nr:FAD-binding oxidoreductase [Eubacteriales bacterium]MDD4389994.1 FAD-binding oxidoreductase [Eubacteriales bacterium]